MRTRRNRAGAPIHDLGDEAARRRLVRWLARSGQLDELRQRAESDDYVRDWLAAAPAGRSRSGRRVRGQALVGQAGSRSGGCDAAAHAGPRISKECRRIRPGQPATRRCTAGRPPVRDLIAIWPDLLAADYTGELWADGFPARRAEPLLRLCRMAVTASRSGYGQAALRAEQRSRRRAMTVVALAGIVGSGIERDRVRSDPRSRSTDTRSSLLCNHG